MMPVPESSPAATLVNGQLPLKLSTARKYMLLLVFCLAQFMDAFNNSALFSAIPQLKVDLDMNTGEATWIISAFQLTFASFLLVSGRIADVYNPKYTFISGLAGLGIISIGAGFVTSKIPLIILRAITGIAGAMTIPSALNLIVNIFRDPFEQARAIGVFGGCGAIGNVLGLVIGGIFVQYANWRWVFWFVTLVATPIAGLSALLIPGQQPRKGLDGEPEANKFRSLDLVGVSILTAALILFIFAVTSGSTDGWGTAIVLAPLIIAVFLIAGFLYWETIIPEDRASVPPRTWFYPNFAVLFAVALFPYLWWVTIFTVIMILWQQVYNWTVISAAVHMLPIGVLAFVASFSGPLSRRISPKWILLFGLTCVAVATILLALADSADKYWSMVFPAFVIGSGGCMLTYTHTGIALFRSTPSRVAGTVGAIYNGALQLGSAVGIAAVTSIETSVESKLGLGGFQRYDGRRAAFWFILALVALEAAAVAVMYRVGHERDEEDEVSEVAGTREVVEKEERSNRAHRDLDEKETEMA